MADIYLWGGIFYLVAYWVEGKEGAIVAALFWPFTLLGEVREIFRS